MKSFQQRKTFGKEIESFQAIRKNYHLNLVTYETIQELAAKFNERKINSMASKCSSLFCSHFESKQLFRMHDALILAIST